MSRWYRDWGFTYHTEHNKNVTRAQEGVIFFQFIKARADLHSAQHKAEENENNEYPAEISLEEDDVTVVSVPIHVDVSTHFKTFYPSPSKRGEVLTNTRARNVYESTGSDTLNSPSPTSNPQIATSY
jgi:hypothetical protein